MSLKSLGGRGWRKGQGVSEPVLRSLLTIPLCFQMVKNHCDSLLWLRPHPFSPVFTARSFNCYRGHDHKQHLAPARQSIFGQEITGMNLWVGPCPPGGVCHELDEPHKPHPESLWVKPHPQKPPWTVSAARWRVSSFLPTGLTSAPRPHSAAAFKND